MANRAVFLDRDRTLIEDPGYLSDPNAVKLLPGVELALKSLAGAGYKLIVVTNQSGVARGLLTEESLEKIHAELCRQLATRGAHLDSIYYCPYHSEGTVEKYAIDSDLRKPRPGMLIKASRELDIDLSASWMVGDSSRDVGAGQRAGCRTIRLRGQADSAPRDKIDNDVQADFTVANVAEAARVILRQPPWSSKPGSQETAPTQTFVAQSDTATNETEKIGREILQHVRQLARAERRDTFSFAKVAAGVTQALAVLALAGTLASTLTGKPTEHSQIWALITIALQVMALTFFTIDRTR